MTPYLIVLSRNLKNTNDIFVYNFFVLKVYNFLMKNIHFSEDEGDAGHSAVSGSEPGHRAHLLRGDVPLLPHPQTHHQRLRGGQHPLYPPLQGAGHGQDTAVVHVCHRHSTAAHGKDTGPL